MVMKMWFQAGKCETVPRSQVLRVGGRGPLTRQGFSAPTTAGNYDLLWWHARLAAFVTAGVEVCVGGRRSERR